MELIVNKTKIKHKTFGIGVLKKVTDGTITVLFDEGKKDLNIAAFEWGVISIYQDPATEVIPTIQYNACENPIGGVNVAPFSDKKSKLVINESYTLIGKTLTASEVVACYDLTVIGDLQAQKINTNKRLLVTGNIKTKQLYCGGDLICLGRIEAEDINVGGQIIAKTIKAINCQCNDKAFINDTLDVSTIEAETIFAGEGIISDRTIKTKAAVANEYVDLQGEIEGTIWELSTAKATTKTQQTTAPIQQNDNQDYISLARKQVRNQIEIAGEESEEKIIKYLQTLSKELFNSPETWERVFARIVEISYLDKIDNLKDYLMIYYAQQILPKELWGYETVEHVFQKVYINAAVNVNNLQYSATSIEEFALSLKIVLDYDDLQIDRDVALDKIFQSVGIKYQTVKDFLSRN